MRNGYGGLEEMEMPSQSENKSTVNLTMKRSDAFAKQSEVFLRTSLCFPIIKRSEVVTRAASSLV